GAPTSLAMHDMGLSTIIGKANKDSTGKPLSGSMKSSIERLRTWDSRTQAHSSADRNLRQALNEMDKLKDKLALADVVVEKAAYIYRKAMEKKLVRGRSIHGLVAACLYAACRNTETPRTLDDMANGINIRRKDVARCYRLIFRELELKMPVVDPVKGVSRIASIADLSEKSKRKAILILNKAKDVGMVAGKDPMGIAAAALYLSCISSGESKSQKEISIASGVTEVTIRNRCAGLRQLLKDEQ
ncbi:MAG: transcription initiation factor IIB family protein, partial [Nitrosopumilaceae archaeon]